MRRSAGTTFPSACAIITQAAVAAFKNSARLPGELRDAFVVPLAQLAFIASSSSMRQLSLGNSSIIFI